ncbi:MAG: hypothetical protein WAL25_00335 [Acidimicrobiia bacterium]
MRDYELELIAALVEGRLDDETEARALIDSAPGFRAEYEAQMIAYSALSTVGTTSLTDSERSTMRRDLWTELRAPAPAVSTPWYYLWAPVAAGLLVVVGVVAVINQSGSSDDSATEAAEFISTSTTAAATDATEGGALAGADTPDTADGDDGASVTTEAADEGGGDSVTEDTAAELSSSDEAYYAAEADRIREEVAADVDQSDGEAPRSDPQACLDESGLDGYSVVGTYPAPLPDVEGEEIPEVASPYIAAMPEGADVEEAPIAFVDLLTCALILIDR